MISRVSALLGASILAIGLAASCGTPPATQQGAGDTGAATATGARPDSATSHVAGTTVIAPAVTGTAAETPAATSPMSAATATAAGEVAPATLITLQGDTIQVAGEGARVDGSTVTITAAGAYRLSGSLANGQVAVDTGDEEAVQLILDGVNIHHATGAALNIVKAETVEIVLAGQTQNYLSDGADYVFADPEGDEPNAALFSKADLTIAGAGALVVEANYNDGIASKDGLVIAGGTITVHAADDGLRGKDYLVVQDGVITVNAQGDGLKSDEEEDAAKGYIAVAAGLLQVTAGGDAIQAQTNVVITGGEFVLVSGGGHDGVLAQDASAKGIKAALAVEIEDGRFAIDSADDAIHANGSVTIQDGVFTLASGDDGIHADATLTVNGGEIAINQSVEGLESAAITLNAGNVSVVSSDDGINVAGGNDGSGMPGGGMPPPGMAPGAPPPQDTFAAVSNQLLAIHGGTIVVDAAGDGLDVNGAIEMTGGMVIVHGPTERMNGALDYDRGFTMTGGFMVAAGSAGMAQAPDATSTQPSVLVYFDTVQSAGTPVHVQSSAGETLFSFVPSKAYQSLAFSSPDLVAGATYSIYLGGTVTGTGVQGLYQDGSYTPGTQAASFTVGGAVTQVGSGGMGRRR